MNGLEFLRGVLQGVRSKKVRSNFDLGIIILNYHISIKFVKVRDKVKTAVESLRWKTKKTSAKSSS